MAAGRIAGRPPARTVHYATNVMDFELLKQRVDEGWGVDLHAHSRHSDGAWTPTELIRDGLVQGVRVMALTDHDTVAGQAEFAAAGAEAGMAIVTGAEVTTRVNGRAYHLLCYDLDPSADAWKVIYRNRHDRIGEYYLAVLAQLRERGYPVRDEDVRTPEGGFVRNAISQSLVSAGVADDLRTAQALVKSLQLDFPLHLIGTPVEQLGDLLGRDGALVSVAHPAREERGVSNRLNEDDLLTMKRHLPMAALEAHHRVPHARRHRLLPRAGRAERAGGHLRLGRARLGREAAAAGARAGALPRFPRAAVRRQPVGARA